MFRSPIPQVAYLCGLRRRPDSNRSIVPLTTPEPCGSAPETPLVTPSTAEIVTRARAERDLLRWFAILAALVTLALALPMLGAGQA